MMNVEEEKKKYWCGQIKSMIGPCMITFAIPLMVPGFTITFVAFADEDAFPKYGALHIVGIFILAVSIILIFSGCFLRFYWKPVMDPDLERYLSPNVSFRNIHTDRHNSGIIKVEKQASETLSKNASRRSSLQKSELDKQDGIPIIDKKSKSESETEGTGSESDLKKSLTGNNKRTFNILDSPRCRNLTPVNSNCTDDFVNFDHKDIYENEFPEKESFEALQEWRKKKKAKKKRKTHENKTDSDRKIDIETTQEISTNDLNNSEATQSQKPKRKKKKKVLKSMQEEKKKGLEHHRRKKQSSSHTCDKEDEDSDHSSISIGSADSVLAQYTSRSERRMEEDIKALPLINQIEASAIQEACILMITPEDSAKVIRTESGMGCLQIYHGVTVGTN